MNNFLVFNNSFNMMNVVSMNKCMRVFKEEKNRSIMKENMVVQKWVEYEMMECRTPWFSLPRLQYFVKEQRFYYSSLNL